MRARAILVAVMVPGAWGCSSSSSNPGSPGPVDAGIDARVVRDAGPPDAAPPPPFDASLDGSATPDASDAGAPDADAAPVCPWTGTYESPACAACLESMCCAATATCEGDPACVALDSCVNGCLTAAAEDGGSDAGSVSDCANACFDAQGPTTRDEWHAFSDCIGVACGGNSGAGPCL